MKALIIDTSSFTSSIIVIKDFKVSFFKTLNSKNLTQNIFLELKTILDEEKIDFKDLSYVAASIGPGSFTSLRVGASILKTLSFVHNIPIITYESLLASLPNQDADYLSVLDAKSNSLFIMQANVKEGSIKDYLKPKIISLNDIDKYLDEKKVIVSTDFDGLEEKLESVKNKFEKVSINPYILADFTNQKFIDKKFTDYKDFEIMYLKGEMHT